jgi:hypothetical protein
VPTKVTFELYAPPLPTIPPQFMGLSPLK